MFRRARLKMLLRKWSMDVLPRAGLRAATLSLAA